MCSFCNWRKLFWVIIILCSLFECRMRWHCVCGFFVQFKQSFLAGLFWFHSSFADYPYVTYVGVFFLRIRFMSQFFPLFTHTICSTALYVFLSFSPVEFVSVLFAIATHCHKKQFVLNNTSAFSRSPNDYLLMSRFTKKKQRRISNNTDWTCKYEKCVQKHRFLHDTLPRNGNATSNAMHTAVHTYTQ